MGLDMFTPGEAAEKLEGKPAKSIMIFPIFGD
jgi:hypothetical protein